MANWFKRLWNDKRGNAVILAGASLPLIVASAGFATDTIQWTLWKRQLQRAADSSAMAGVYATVAGQTSSSAITNDLVYNQNTGMTLSSGYPIVTYPADTADWDHAIKVQLAVSKPLSFSGMFGQTPLITASATAAIADSGKYCVISLESSSTTGIIDTGNATLDIGCGMITNSTSHNAACAAGSVK